eukprot:768667-Hanusia_phi.AAC.1
MVLENATIPSHIAPFEAASLFSSSISWTTEVASVYNNFSVTIAGNILLEPGAQFLLQGFTDFLTEDVPCLKPAEDCRSWRILLQGQDAGLFDSSKTTWKQSEGTLFVALSSGEVLIERASFSFTILNPNISDCKSFLISQVYPFSLNTFTLTSSLNSLPCNQTCLCALKPAAFQYANIDWNTDRRSSIVTFTISFVTNVKWNYGTSLIISGLYGFQDPDNTKLPIKILSPARLPGSGAGFFVGKGGAWDSGIWRRSDGSLELIVSEWSFVPSNTKVSLSFDLLSSNVLQQFRVRLATVGEVNIHPFLCAVRASKLSESFSYTQPSVFLLQPNTGLSVGKDLVFLKTNHFGTADYTPNFKIGSTLCESSRWISDTLILLKVAAGINDSPVCQDTQMNCLHSIGITIVDDFVLTKAKLFRYEYPFISAISPANGGTAGGFIATVSGGNFGTYDNSMNVQFIARDTDPPRNCELTSWVSDSSALCKVPRIGRKVSVDVVAFVSHSYNISRNATFIYNAPKVTGVLPKNSPTTGGVTVTFLGEQFGLVTTKLSARIGPTSANSSTWNSDSTVFMYSPPGVGTVKSVVLSIINIEVELSRDLVTTFYFNKPTIEVSKNSSMNGPTRIQNVRQVNIIGSNFGTTNVGWYYDKCIRYRNPLDQSLLAECLSGDSTFFGIGDTNALISTWTSDTFIVGNLIPGHRSALEIQANISYQIGTSSLVFSYDIPVATSSTMVNFPSDISQMFTIVGKNYGIYSASMKLRSGQTNTERSAWVSDGQISVRPSRGISGSLAMSLTMGSGGIYPNSLETLVQQIGTISSLLSYDIFALFASRPSRFNAGIQFSNHFEVSGTGIGIVSLTPKSSASLALSSVGMSGTLSLAFSYDSPTISAVQSHLKINNSLYSLPTTDNRTISSSNSIATYNNSFLCFSNAPSFSKLSCTQVFGSNFLPHDRTGRTRFEKSSAESTLWFSYTSLIGKPVSSRIADPSISLIVLTLAVLPGSLTRAFSIDFPTVSSVESNGPMHQSRNISLNGADYGSYDVTSQARVGGCLAPQYDWSRWYGPDFVKYCEHDYTASTSCEDTRWNSDTELVCQIPYGVGDRNSVVSTLWLAQSTITYAFSFDGYPRILNLIPTNAPPRGSSATEKFSLTLIGLNFGDGDFSPSGRVGRTTCVGSMWLTSSSLICMVPAGLDFESDTSFIRDAGSIVLTVNLQQRLWNTLSWAFSYTVPSLSGLSAKGNVASTSAVWISIVGENLARFDTSHFTSLGSTASDASIWLSDTAITSKISSGQSGSLSLRVTLNLKVGTLTEAVSYSKPCFSQVARGNYAATGSLILTVLGKSFGMISCSPKGQIGWTCTELTTWNSETSINCMSPVALLKQLKASLTISHLTGSVTQIGSYDAVDISHVGGEYLVHNEKMFRSFVLVRNAGCSDLSMQARAAMSSAEATLWKSDTQVEVRRLPISRANRPTNVYLTSSQLFSTASFAFSLERAQISTVTYNYVDSFNATLSMTGNYLSMYDTSLAVRISPGTASENSEWISETSITGKYQQALSSSITLIVTNAWQGTTSDLVSFDFTFITTARSSNVPTSGDHLTCFGLRLYDKWMSLASSVADTANEASLWLSDSSISSLLANGVVSTARIHATVATRVCTITDQISYDIPNLQQIVNFSQSFAPNSPSTGCVQIEVVGLNMGLGDFSNSQRVGMSSCEQTTWKSQTSVRALTPSGFAPILLYSEYGGAESPQSVSSGSVSLILTSGVRTGTEKSSFTYSKPNLYRVSCQNVKRGEMSAWNSESSIYATVPAGQLDFLDVTATIGIKVSTLSHVLSYDGAWNHLTQISPSNAPMTGQVTLTLAGYFHACKEQNCSVQVGESFGACVPWSSDSQLFCAIPPGMYQYQDVRLIANLESLLSNALSYDSPVINNASISNFASSCTDGRSIVTIAGPNMGIQNYNASVRIGGTDCLQTAWNSQSSLTCMVAQSVGFDLGTTITLLSPEHISWVDQNNTRYTDILLSSFATSRFAMFTYDSVPLSNRSFQKSNIPLQSFKVDFELSGFACGLSHSFKVRIGLTACEETRWISFSSIPCRPWKSSITQSMKMIVTVSNSIGQLSNAVTYDNLLISSAKLSSISANGTFVFAFPRISELADYTPHAGLVSTSCESTLWKNTSQILCKVANGIGKMNVLRFTTGVRLNTALFPLTYELTIKSLESQPGSKPGETITVLGKGFGFADYTPLASVENVLCQATTWVSDSSAFCKKPSTLKENRYTIEVGNQSVTWIPILLEDTNGPMTGNVLLTVRGIAFTQQNVLAIGSTLCMTTVWISDTSMYCLLSEGVGDHLTLSLYLNSTISSTSIVNQSARDAVLEGVGDHLTLSLYLNSTISSTNIVNQSARDAVLSLDDAFIYDYPSIFLSELANCSIVESLTPFEQAHCSKYNLSSNNLSSLPIFQQNHPTSGMILLSVKGDNFGVNDYSPSFQISSTSAELTNWHSNTALLAISSPGIGNDLASNVKFDAFVDKYQGTSNTFSYNIPQLSSQVPFNSYSASNATIYLSANFLGYSDYTGRVRVSSTSISAVCWISDSQLTIKKLGGEGSSLSVQMSVGLQNSTTSQLFSFDFRKYIGFSRSNDIKSSFHFIAQDIFSTLHFRISPSQAESTIWESETSVVVKLVPGVTRTREIQITLAIAVTSQSESLSYLIPSISAVKQSNFGGSLMNEMTLIGWSFANKQISASVRLTLTSSRSTLWISSSCVVTRFIDLSQSSLRSIVTTSMSVGTISQVCSFDRKLISSMNPVNGPQAGKSAVVLYGSFSLSHSNTPFARIGSSCLNTKTIWTSDSAVGCFWAYGGTNTLRIAVSSLDQIGTITDSLSYDQLILSTNPNVTYLSANSPSSGSIYISLYQNLYLISQFTPCISFGHTKSEMTSWRSDTWILSKVPVGIGGSLALKFTIVMVSGTACKASSYDMPATSKFYLQNAPVLPYENSTYFGSYFATFDVTPKERHFSTSGEYTAWISDSIMVVKVPYGFQKSLSTVVTVHRMANSQSESFSYDSANVQVGRELGNLSVAVNLPGTGSRQIYVLVSKLPVSDCTIRTRLAGSSSEQSLWLAVSSVLTRSASSEGISCRIVLSLSHTTSSATRSLTFDVPPYMSTILRGNSAKTGAVTMSIVGQGFSSFGLTARARSSSACISTSWISDSTIRAKLMSGSGTSKLILSVISFQKGSATEYFTMDNSNLKRFASFLANRGSSGSSSLTVYGGNFGTVQFCLSSRMTQSVAENTRWIAASSVVCKPSSGQIATRSVQMTVVERLATSSRLFSYDANLVSKAVRSNAAGTGSISVTLVGSMLGIDAVTIQTRF